MKDKAQQTDIFLHLVKTGGQSLGYTLIRLYKLKNSFPIDSEDYRMKEREFAALPQDERNQFDLIRGHMFFGFHEYIETPCRYFSIIRNPKDRIVSLYNYLYDHRLFPEIKKRGLNFEQFLAEEITDLADNGITRFISGIDIDEVPYGQCNDAMLEQAKKNVREHFCLMGDIKKYDETLIVLKEILGWKEEPYYDITNVSRVKRITTKEIDFTNQDILKFIYYDIKLYEFAIDYFEPVFEKHQTLIQNRLTDFKKENKAFQNKYSRRFIKGVKKVIVKGVNKIK